VQANLDDILAQAISSLGEAQNINQLDQVRVSYLGKKGLFTLQMKELASLDSEQRRSVGQIINQAKDEFQKQLQVKKDFLDNLELERRLASERIDVTLPGRGQSVGGLHPVTRT
jgi:phenylalanyl-tRNA synthetase alpha chain